MSATEPTNAKTYGKALEQVPNFVLWQLYARVKTNLMLASVCRQGPVPETVLEFAKAVNREISLRRLDQKRGSHERNDDFSC